MNEKYRANDIIAIVAKGGLGTIPVLGPLAAEIVGGIIPNQRLDRLEDTVVRLEAMLDDDGKRLFKSKMYDPEFLDLFEDTMMQAGHAISEERRQYLATIVKNGITVVCHEHEMKKRLIETFAHVNNVEILLLKQKSLSPSAVEGFIRKHQVAINPPVPYIGAPPADIEKASLHDSYYHNLVNLGLLKDEGTIFEDRKDVPFSMRTTITPFGWCLLRYLDLALDQERPYDPTYESEFRLDDW